MVPNPTEVAQSSRNFLLAEPGIRLALLYGSTASGKMRPDSDVDLAVLFDHPLDAARRVGLAERLETLLARTVDLVDLSSLSGTILKQILCGGIVLFKKDTEALASLTRKMIFNQADVMPYVRRTLEERQRRFLHG